MNDFAWKYQIKSKSYNGFHLFLSNQKTLDIINKIELYRKAAINLSRSLSVQALNLKKLKPIPLFKLKILTGKDCESNLYCENEKLIVILNNKDLEYFKLSLDSYALGNNDFNIKIGDDSLWFW